MNDDIIMHNPSHIGAFVREVIEGHDLNISSAAKVLGVTRQAMSTLVNENGGISADMALRIEKAFGVRMDTLLKMQTAWEIAEARKRAPLFDIPRYLAA